MIEKPEIVDYSNKTINERVEEAMVDYINSGEYSEEELPSFIVL